MLCVICTCVLTIVSLAGILTACLCQPHSLLWEYRMHSATCGMSIIFSHTNWSLQSEVQGVRGCLAFPLSAACLSSSSPAQKERYSSWLPGWWDRPRHSLDLGQTELEKHICIPTRRALCKQHNSLGFNKAFLGDDRTPVHSQNLAPLLSVICEP